tara:strand:- start:1441 stop:1812 length:372 start_codon:yes stop_codon:yes gene_type:complete
MKIHNPIVFDIENEKGQISEQKLVWGTWFTLDGDKSRSILECVHLTPTDKENIYLGMDKDATECELIGDVEQMRLYSEQVCLIEAGYTPKQVEALNKYIENTISRRFEIKPRLSIKSEQVIQK